jgi:hypothetical protein
MIIIVRLIKKMWKLMFIEEQIEDGLQLRQYQ